MTETNKNPLYDAQFHRDRSATIGEYLDEVEAEKQQTIQESETNAAEIEARKAELLNSHETKEASQFGLRENLTELKNAFTGGARDTVSSYLTLPERAVDIASGEMMNEIRTKGKYTPQFNPVGGELNPITKTWWGNFIRTGVHFGTMAIPIVGWGSAVAKGTGWAAKIAQWTVASSNWIAKGASVGAFSDLFSEYSQDSNGLQVLRDRFGFIDTPCTTNDSDHPTITTLKSVCEGVTLGIPLEGTVKAIGRVRLLKGKANNPTNEVLKQVDTIQSDKILKAEKAAKELVNLNLMEATRQRLFNQGIDFDQLTPETQIAEMAKVAKKSPKRFSTWTPPNEDNVQRAQRKLTTDQKSINDQVVEKAQTETGSPGPRGHLNKQSAEFGVGSPNSTGSAWDGTKAIKRMTYEWSSMEQGSTDSLITPAAAEALAEVGSGRTGIIDTIAKELFGDVRYRRVLSELEAKGQTLQSVYGEAFESMQEVIGGREAAELSPEDFWRPLFENADTKDNFNVWSTKNVLAANLIQESLFKQLRNRAIAARELIDVTNIEQIDGPISYIRNNLIVGLEQVKRSQFLNSPEYLELKAQKGGRRLIDERLTEIHNASKNQTDLMFDLAYQSPTDDLLHAFLEAMSMSHKINNWQDFGNYMQKKLVGSTTPDGQRATGAIIKELQGVMINSILSGPKTPLRAIMGTSTATFLRPTANILGGAGRYLMTGFTDDSSLRNGLAEINAMRQAIPDSWEYFKQRLNGYWAGELSTVKSRYAEYTLNDQQWDLMRYWAEDSGTATLGEQAAFQLTNTARWMNHSNWFNYTMKLLASTDDAFTMILARARSRSKALQGAMDAQSRGLIPEITPELIREYESRLQSDIFNPKTGVVNDKYLEYARGEVTLTKDLTGFARSLDTLFSTYPMLKPFHLFARTGINGLELTMKHTPGLNLFVEEFRDIARATPDNLSGVVKYGIESAQELKNAKDLQMGRLAMGSGIIFMASQKYMNGELTGEGPASMAERRSWEAAGWKPNSIKLGGVWIGFESLEPFNSMLTFIANLGDNQRLLGNKYVERGLLASALVLSKGMVTKTYLQGMTSLTDLFSDNPKKLERIGANILNNVLPYGTLRNEMGKLFNPYMKELNSDFENTVRNRNQLLEYFGEEGNRLPVKYDILNGQPIRDHDFPTRLFNMLSPVNINFDPSPGRKFLFRSQYNIGLITETSPDGISLADQNTIRSKFQKAIGSQNLEVTLERLARRPDVQRSIEIMENDIENNRHKMKPGINPMEYVHNKLIHAAITDARNRAWALLSSDINVVQLIEAARQGQIAEAFRSEDPGRSRTAYNEANQILEMLNK